MTNHSFRPIAAAGLAVCLLCAVARSPAYAQFGGLYGGRVNIFKPNQPVEDHDAILSVPDGAGEQVMHYVEQFGLTFEITAVITGNTFTGFTINIENDILPVDGMFSGSDVAMTIIDGEKRFEFEGSLGGVGACRIGEDNCALVTEEFCHEEDGVYDGDGTVCDDDDDDMADTMRWKNPNGGVYSTEENWDPEQVPVHNAERSDTAVFLVSGNLPVQCFSNDTAGRWLIQGTQLDLTGSAQVLGDIGDEMPLQILNGGSVRVAGGATLLSNGAEIGAAGTGETAGVTITGNNSKMTLKSLRIGGAAPGIVTVESRGRLDMQGNMHLGSRVGNNQGNGKLKIQNAAAVTGISLFAGNQLDSRGDIEVRGATADKISTLQLSGILKLGEGNGSGSLLVEDGALVSADEASFGGPAIADAVKVVIRGIHSAGHRSTLSTGPGAGFGTFVSGAAGTEVDVKDGGHWRSMDAVTIGGSGARTGRVIVHNPDANLPPFDASITNSGAAWIAEQSISLFAAGDTPAELIVKDRGVVNAQSLDVGSRARVTVEGAGSNLLAVALDVGGDQSAELHVTSGGQVVSQTGTVQAFGFDRADVFIEDESRWDVVGDMLVSGNARVLLTGGGLFADGGTLLVGGTLTVTEGGIIAGNGTLQAATRVVNNGGAIDPGLSPGMIVIDGDYEQTEAGRLMMEAAGLGEGQFDVLKVTGNATMGGTLEMRFIDGYLPRAGDAFDFVQADAGIAGQFASVIFPDLEPGFETELTVSDDGKLRLTAINDAVAIGGAAPAPDCGAGMCGAGVAMMMQFSMLGLLAVRRRLVRT